MKRKVSDILTKLRACSEAVEWSKAYGSNHQKAWDECNRGDHLLWLLGKLSGPPESEGRKKLVLASCACAQLALKYVKDGEHRPRICIETAEAWANGQATIEQVRTARQDSRNAAYAAAAAAYAAAAADAAAAYAAYAAAAAAAYAAAYAAAAAAYAYAAAARSKMLAKCADVVRKHYPKAPRL